MTAPKVRVHEISKVLGVPNAEVIDALAKEFGVQVKSHSSTVEQSIADTLIARFNKTAPTANVQSSSVQAPKAAPSVEKQPSVQHAAPSASHPPKPTAQAAPASTGQQSGQPSGPRPQSQDAAFRPARPEQQHSGQRPPQAPHRPAQPGQFSGQRPQGQGQQFPSQGQQRPHGGPSSPGHHRPAQPGGGGYPPQQRPMGQMGQQPSRPGYGPSRPPENSSMGQRPPQGGAGSGKPLSHRPPQKPGGNRPQSNKGKQRPEKQLMRSRREEEIAVIQSEPQVVRIDEAIIVRDLAAKLKLRETEIIKHLFMKGMMVTVNQTLDVDFAKTVAKEFGFEVEEVAQAKHEGEYAHLDGDSRKKLDEAQFQNLTGRWPVVSIMGHVDHGKTTLLDAIRETRHKIVDTEAGGITQSIGAYTVQKGEQQIVFLDTPGHEAFTAMRMRGAQATDIAILVVAADDGVMPQTIEAINHAKAAKIPIIVAVNKIDKADADPDRVLVKLADYGLSAEKWGGDTLTVEVSALQRLGLDDVLDSILLVAELLELKADATVPAEGVIIEAQLDKRMGPVATALVQNGTLKVGDNVLIGSVGGRVRALIDDHGQRVNSAGPASPVGILGLDGVPKAGDAFRVITNDKLFKQELAGEKQRQRDERIGTRSVAGFSGRMEAEENKENQFNLLVKADTQGSLEAVVDVLQRMTSDEIKINIVHSATGDISEADVMLASTANALIIGFNTKADANGQRLAEQGDVVIKRYDVIYHITDDIEKWVLGQLAPETEEVHAGTAEVRQIFKVGKAGVIAGCMVTQGKIIRNAKANVLRNGKEVFSGLLNNLKRFKDDAKEVASGYECGISFERFQDLQEGDIIEVYTVKSMERTSL